MTGFSIGLLSTVGEGIAFLISEEQGKVSVLNKTSITDELETDIPGPLPPHPPPCKSPGFVRHASGNFTVNSKLGLLAIEGVISHLGNVLVCGLI